jgi:hypothetical protein
MKAKQQILAHTAFKGSLTPLPISEGGSLAPINDADMAEALKTDGTTFSALSTFWAMDMVFTPTPGIPISMDRVMRLTTEYLAKPTPSCPFQFTIAVPDQSWTPSTHFGSWSRVSPEEFAHAIVFAIRRDLQDPKVTADTLKVWTTMLRNVQYNFISCSGPDAMYFWSSKCRERLVSGASAARWNGLQRTRSIISYHS